MRSGTALVFLFFLATVAVAAPAANDKDKLTDYRRTIRQNQTNLKDMHQRLDQEKKIIKTVVRQEHSLLSEIQGIDRRLEEAEDRYQEYQQNLAIVRDQIRAIRRVIARTEAELDDLRNFLADRLRLLYREGRGGVARILLAARTFSEALARIKFFHALAWQNAALIEKTDRQRQDLSSQHQKLAQQEQQLRQLESEAQQTLNRIQQQRQAREQLLGKIREQRTSHEQAVRELTAAAGKLNQLIRQLEQNAKSMEKKSRTTATPASLPTRVFPWPTRGRVIARFGRVRHPRFNTYLLNKGIDIAGPIGQNVISVARGQVLYAEWFEGYGRMIILDHGNGLNTVYAHLQNIYVSAGDKVEERQVIGRLGDSGTWKGPSLYFEIRSRGEALDPQRWLEP